MKNLSVYDCSVIENFSTNPIVLMLSSLKFSEGDYIRNFNDLIETF